MKTKFSFDNYNLDRLSPDGSHLIKTEERIGRPHGLTQDDWFTLASSVIRLLNKYEANPWRSMATAPHDNSVVLLWVAFSDGPRAISARWNTEWGCWEDIQQSCGIDEGLDKGWMPIPEQPTTNDNGH